MQPNEPQPGDRVQLVGQAGPGVLHETFLQGAPVLVVERQMPYDPDRYELSDGSLHAASELHLVERPASVEVEHFEISQTGQPDHRIGTRAKHAASAAEGEV